MVIVAVMRKLLLLAWTLLRSGQSFAALAPSRRLESAGRDAQTSSPGPSLATTQPAGS